MGTKKAALDKLREDWLAENSDAREEGVTRWQLDNQIGHAKKRTQEEPENHDRQVDLAAAYGVLDPGDKRCLNVTERLLGTGGINTLDTQRKGEAYMLHGRSVFLAGKYEDCLGALQKAQICFKEKGNFKLRRQVNRGLLRVLCALGRGREASERLEVALTLCEDKDDCVQLYISAKQALEHTGCDRDREILDDIWYVFLETHPEEKKKFEEYESTGMNLVRQFAGNEERSEEPAETWAAVWQRVKDPAVWQEILPQVMEDLKGSKFFLFLLQLLGFVVVAYLLLMLTLYFKTRGPVN